MSGILGSQVMCSKRLLIWLHLHFSWWFACWGSINIHACWLHSGHATIIILCQGGGLQPDHMRCMHPHAPTWTYMESVMDPHGPWTCWTVFVTVGRQSGASPLQERDSPNTAMVLKLSIGLNSWTSQNMVQGWYTVDVRFQVTWQQGPWPL